MALFGDVLHRGQELGNFVQAIVMAHRHPHTTVKAKRIENVS
jgi:hypothetical protein